MTSTHNAACNKYDMIFKSKESNVKAWERFANESATGTVVTLYVKRGAEHNYLSKGHVDLTSKIRSGTIQLYDDECHDLEKLE